jgi:hypothetical protein
VITQPTDRHGVLARAAQIIQAQGLNHGDFVLDPFNRRSTTSHRTRPMSVVGAIQCAVSGDPRTPSNLAWDAIITLSRVVQVDGQVAWSGSIEDRERHVEAWSDSVSADYAVEMLLLVSGRRASSLAVAA